ncbi:hypothetical protein [Palleronia sp.]|uniref:hypothetical protein n=1 Tax=Palleronia sp. TaxID=1940284 RepID=UPI0035C7D570
MTAIDTLRVLIRDAGGSASLVDALPRYFSSAPDWLNPESDTWNVAPLHRRADVKTYTIDFTRVAHCELRAVARAHSLWQIVERQVGPASLCAALNVFVHLGNQIGSRPLSTLKTEDFLAVERLLKDRYAQGTSARACADLQRVATWLNRQTGLHLDYTSTLRPAAVHGREATDESRYGKLLPDAVVADLLAARHDPDLSDRDRFFLAAIAISVATGFRLSELLAIPVDCLIQDEGTLLVRSFVSKHGKAAPRPVPPELADIVVNAVEHIRAVTEPARHRAQALAQNAPTDWSSVVRAPDSVLEYFLRLWLADWIADPEHRMIDLRWAYYSRGKRSQWFPIADLLERYEGNLSAISRELNVSRASVARMVKQIKAAERGEVYLGARTAEARRGFDTDRRFPSVDAFRALTGLNLHNSPRKGLLSKLIEKARVAQITQATFVPPAYDKPLEEHFRATPDVLRDRETGGAALSMYEALFILFKNQLSASHNLNDGRVKAVSIQQFNHWLSGYARDRGTGKPGDAVCARLCILDPRTEQPARFTNHDFRHWLETAYENGGLSQTQIAALFNRSSTTSNSVYDQTNSAIRGERIKDAMADGLLVGHAPEAYARIAKDSPEEAAEYLETATKFHNPMPHGICRLNWALEPCPHALSCFSCGDAEDDLSEPCEHLVVDIEDAGQLEEIARIHRNAQSITEIMEDEGVEGNPQYTQFCRVARSTHTILTKARAS